MKFFDDRATARCVALHLTAQGACVHHAAMSGFLLALLTTVIAGFGARDQMLVAGLAHQPSGQQGGRQDELQSSRAGARPAVLLVALITALGTAAAAGWAGFTIAPLLVPRARTLLVAMALGLAALELMLIRPGRRAEEPTASLGAFAIVLVAQQLTDAARLLVFVMAASSAVPQLAAAGGMLGGAATVTVGWLAGSGLAHWPLIRIRRGLGLLLAGVAVWIVL